MPWKCSCLVQCAVISKKVGNCCFTVSSTNNECKGFDYKVDKKYVKSKSDLARGTTLSRRHFEKREWPPLIVYRTRTSMRQFLEQTITDWPGQPSQDEEDRSVIVIRSILR